MVMLNELQSNEYARIVDIQCKEVIKQKFFNHGVTEGCFVRIVYSHSCIIVKINSKLFNISKNLAGKIRVIKVGGQ
jgi:Fe2+ transport system protein FeoA